MTSSEPEESGGAQGQKGTQACSPALGTVRWARPRGVGLRGGDAGRAFLVFTWEGRRLWTPPRRSARGLGWRGVTCQPLWVCRSACLRQAGALSRGGLLPHLLPFPQALAWEEPGSQSAMRLLLDSSFSLPWQPPRPPCSVPSHRLPTTPCSQPRAYGSFLPLWPRSSLSTCLCSQVHRNRPHSLSLSPRRQGPLHVRTMTAFKALVQRQPQRRVRARDSPLVLKLGPAGCTGTPSVLSRPLQAAQNCVADLLFPRWRFSLCGEREAAVCLCLFFLFTVFIFMLPCIFLLLSLPNSYTSSRLSFLSFCPRGQERLPLVPGDLSVVTAAHRIVISVCEAPFA